jgi:hypothetical protein
MAQKFELKSQLSIGDQLEIDRVLAIDSEKRTTEEAEFLDARDPYVHNRIIRYDTAGIATNQNPNPEATTDLILEAEGNVLPNGYEGFRKGAKFFILTDPVNIWYENKGDENSAVWETVVEKVNEANTVISTSTQKPLTNNAATPLFRVTIEENSVFVAVMRFSIIGFDGTDLTFMVGDFVFGCTNKSGVISNTYLGNYNGNSMQNLFDATGKTTAGLGYADNLQFVNDSSTPTTFSMIMGDLGSNFSGGYLRINYKLEILTGQDVEVIGTPSASLSPSSSQSPSSSVSSSISPSSSSSSSISPSASVSPSSSTSPSVSPSASVSPSSSQSPSSSESSSISPSSSVSPSA